MVDSEVATIVWSRLARNIANISPDRTETISDRDRWIVVDCVRWATTGFGGARGPSVQGRPIAAQQPRAIWGLRSARIGANAAALDLRDKRYADPLPAATATATATASAQLCSEGADFRGGNEML